MAPASLIDAAGVVHPPAGGDPRIVSLVPSLTELLFDLGLGNRVVGRTAFCTRPQKLVGAVPGVGGTKTVDLDRLRRLDPTHVIVNVDETPRDLAEGIAAAGIRVVVTHPVGVRDNLGLYRLLGGIFGRREQARKLAERFEAAYRAVSRSAPRRVLYLIWKDPWMTVSRDTYVSDMLATVGWRTVGGDGGGRYPEVEITESLLAGTDLVLFPDEPFPFEEHHLDAFAAETRYPRGAPGGCPPDFKCGGRPRYPRSRLITIDGAMVSWFGSRAIPALGYLDDLCRRLGDKPDDEQ